MAKKVTYVMGTSPDQIRVYPDGEERTFAGVSTHWHIRKPRTSHGTLCGSVLVRGKGVTTTTKRPKPIKRKNRELSQVCGFCERISRGLDPMFQTHLENRSARKPEEIGTRAKASSQMYAIPGKVIA